MQGAPDPYDPRLFRCAAGVNLFYVNPYGKLNFCSYLRAVSYDLAGGSLLEGVRSLRERLLGQERDEGAPCKTCSIYGSCESCPAKAYLATGDMHSRDPDLCELNQVRRAP